MDGGGTEGWTQWVTRTINNEIVIAGSPEEVAEGLKQMGLFTEDLEKSEANAKVPATIVEGPVSPQTPTSPVAEEAEAAEGTPSPASGAVSDLVPEVRAAAKSSSGHNNEGAEEDDDDDDLFKEK